MPSPTSLSIKTSSVLRLIKEEASYRKETIQQKATVERLEKEGADEYELRQPKKVLEQTIVMAPTVRKQLQTALGALSEALEAAPESESEENKEKARKALDDGRKVIGEYGVPE